MHVCTHTHACTQQQYISQGIPFSIPYLLQITQAEVDQYNGGDNIPCIEATVIAGESIKEYAFLFQRVEVQGSITNLSFNLVLQVLPGKPYNNKNIASNYFSLAPPKSKDSNTGAIEETGTETE